MQNIIKLYKENKYRLIFIGLNILFGLISLILYSSSGIIKGYTEEYSVPLIVILIIALLINVSSLFIKFTSLETLGFVGYFVSIIFYLLVNANYLVAIIRAIDITSVNASFISTLVFLILATICGIASTVLAFKTKKE